jgi:hypothetical protein
LNSLVGADKTFEPNQRQNWLALIFQIRKQCETSLEGRIADPLSDGAKIKKGATLGPAALMLVRMSGVRFP